VNRPPAGAVPTLEKAGLHNNVETFHPGPRDPGGMELVRGLG
jgi:hypothetical protein